MADVAALNIKVETTQVKSASKDLDHLASTGAKTEASTKRLSTATDQLQGSMSQLRGVVGGLAAAFGAYKVASYIKDSALLAARYETLGVTMTRAGANAGYTKSEMDSLEKSLRSQGIAAVEARQTLTKLAASNMDLSKASQLARAAQDLAVVANINSSEAFERLVQGIQTGQTETLRTLGINVNFEKSYKDLAKQLNINVDQLTENEKQQARMNAALERAVGFNGLYEDAMSTAGKQINSMKRYVDDLAVSFGSAFNESTASIVKDMTNSIKDMNTAVKDPAFQLGLTGIGQLGANLFGAITYGGTAALQVLGNTMARISGIFIAIDGFVNKHREDIETGKSIAMSADPAKALRMATLARRDIEATRGATPTGQVIAPGALEAEFNIQQVGRERGTNVVREQTASQVAAAKRAQKEAEDLQRKLSDMNAKWEEERGKQYLDNKQAIYDAENEIKLKLINDAYTIATEFDGRALEEQKRVLREQYAAAAEYTQDRVGLAKKLEDELKKLDTARLATSRNAWDGAKVALDSYTDAATNSAANMGRVFTNAFTSMEDALVKFAMTGKLEFKSLVNSIISDIIRMQVREQITGRLSGAISSGSLWSGITGFFGFNHGGGMVGSPTFSREVPLAAFAGAERFHSGGWPGLKSDEVPIIAQRGERVLSRQEVAAGAGGSSGTQTVTVIMKDAKGNQTAAPMSFNTNGMREFILNVVRDGSERGLLGAM